MTNVPLVSIIITSYNKGPYIKESIESALTQSFTNFEVIIIDDGSTDESRDIIRQYQHRDQVTIIYQENHGIVYTRNKAIEQSNGKYIVQLDADDLLHEDFLKWTVDEVESDEKIGIVYCQTSLIGEKNGLWDLGPFSLEKQLQANQIVVTALFRKSDFQLTKGYKKDFELGMEDWDFWLRILALGRIVVQIPKVGFYYRILSNSRNPVNNPNRLTDIRKLIIKHHLDLYLEFKPDWITCLEKEQQLNRENQLIRNSAEYRIGSVLLKPYRLLRNYLKPKIQ
ncbi:MAG: glycosyltransferase family 2 protein [Flavobacteriales bacterium]|nr:glycosyltransferase family 2 protein [Flavobacteriales bacterium]